LRSAHHTAGIHRAPSEIRRPHAAHSIGKPRVVVDIHDIHVVDDVDPAAAYEPSAVPWTENFKRRERHPADIGESKAETKPESTAPTEESNQRRPPIKR
jgi:hypothetical protein